MKCLTTQDANEYLARIGMRIGNWNQITDADSAQKSESSWVNYASPRDSHGLFNFAQHVAGWLPKGEWKIFQIDNSTYLDDVQTNFVEHFLSRSERTVNLNADRTFLFEFGKSQSDDKNTEILISNLIYAFLLFECHAYFVSSNSCVGECLAIQDGYAYFSARDKDVCGAESLLRNFEQQPLASPQWIVEIISEGQEQALRGTDLG